ncbi:Beta-glucosidase 42 [Morus notabilis]|uniref:Beta-glucosidase 42 n=1 Tax=Morus notabilis TaxID=981085 RepID=W9SBV6_9ROSA|nr:beta-glucosidase 42 [Morus notabilis]EXC24933.1 Beta-glucosidase 42 [Morus notabilis]
MVKKEDFFFNNNALSAEQQEEENDHGDISRSDFPPNFVFGVATSAYQVEGACDEGGRGPCIWDAFTHISGNVIDGSNGDIAVDQYHRYKEDVELIAKLGFDAYRISISWSRIFPDGLGTKVNEEGITYYNNIINSLLEKGIEPYVTLYHWDLPLHLHETLDGWLNKEIVKYFSIYADTCFANFGDRVKNWITLNEPLQTAVNGYDVGTFAPGRKEKPETEPYLAAHHQLLAHASAVSIYKSKYKEKQGGKVGMTVDCEWAEANSDKIEDKIAAARRIDFQLGWYLDPIYYGDYPKVMREKLGHRLPKFTEEEKELLTNSLDFVGLNHYTTRFISHVKESPEEGDFYKAQTMERIVEWEGGELIGEKAASEWLYMVPWGIRKVLNYIARRYNNPPIYVTENGMDDEENETSPLHEMLDDKLRVVYFKRYLAAVSQAIKDGADVRGHFAWSLLDNFEWAQGYTKRFGLIYVDYKNGLTRHPKSSAYWFSRFFKGGEGKKSKSD